MKSAQKVLSSGMLTDFKAFIMKGNVVDMAVGIIIGAAFGAIVSSIVKDVIMPPIGLALGNIDFSNLAIVIKARLHARSLPFSSCCPGCWRCHN